MEINVTRFLREAAPMDYSASIAEIGRDAARDTWQAALDDSEDYMFLDTDEKLGAARDYFQGFGAWDREEIDAWTETELNALLIQEIASRVRDPDSGQIYESDGQAYFYMGL